MSDELQIDTAGWLRCQHPGCGWIVSPSYPQCPEHPDVTPLPEWRFPPPFTPDPGPEDYESGEETT